MLDTLLPYLSLWSRLYSRLGVGSTSKRKEVHLPPAPGCGCRCSVQVPLTHPIWHKILSTLQARPSPAQVFPQKQAIFCLKQQQPGVPAAQGVSQAQVCVLEPQREREDAQEATPAPRGRRLKIKSAEKSATAMCAAPFS